MCKGENEENTMRSAVDSAVTYAYKSTYVEQLEEIPGVNSVDII